MPDFYKWAVSRVSAGKNKLFKCSLYTKSKYIFLKSKKCFYVKLCIQGFILQYRNMVQGLFVFFMANVKSSAISPNEV